MFYSNKNLRLFEVGKSYFRDSARSSEAVVDGYVEENHLILAFSGLRTLASWDGAPRKTDLYDAKGEVLTLLKKIFLDNIKFIPYSTTKALTNIGFDVEINGVRVGQVGSVGKSLLSKFEIEEDVFIAELNLDLLLGFLSLKRTFRPLPKYPFVARDIAFRINENITGEELEREIRAAGTSLLTKVELFDVYRGDRVQSGEKSLAFALEFLSEDHTLTQEEVDRIMENIVKGVSRNLGGTLRD